MTTPFVAPDWQGKTVAVLAPGRSLTQAAADTVKHLPRIAVKRAFLMAPDADVLLGIDGPADAEFWAASQEFAGLRVCGVECDLDVMYFNAPAESVTLGEGNTIQFRNNGTSAIRLAALCGASRIMLLGFDRDQYLVGHPLQSQYAELTGALEQAITTLTAQLQTQGIEVERVEPSAPALLETSVFRSGRRARE